MSTIQTVSAPLWRPPIIIETGKLAKLADGAVTVRYGDTLVIVTAVSASKIQGREQDFFPLTVQYRERAAAVGKIPGGYFKREGRPSRKKSSPAARRNARCAPLFPKGYLYDTQIITTLLSADGENDPDILSINGASAALMVSDIPVRQTRRRRPASAASTASSSRSPRMRRWASSDLDLVYVGSETEIIMIEGSALELPEADFKKALDYAREQVQDRHQAPERPRFAASARPSASMPSTSPSPSSSIWPIELVKGCASKARSTAPARSSVTAPSAHSRTRSRSPSRPSTPTATRLRHQLRLRPGPDQGLPRRDPRQAQAQRRSQRERHPPALRRSRSPAPLARFLPLRPRRDPGALSGDARPQRRSAGLSMATPAEM